MKKIHAALSSERLFVKSAQALTCGVIAGSLAVLVPVQFGQSIAPGTLALTGLTVGIVVAFGLAIVWVGARNRAARISKLLEGFNQLMLATDRAGYNEPDEGDWLERAEMQLHAAARAFRSAAVEQQQTQALLSNQAAERAEFFAKLSHELRSPLNAILGYSSILLEQSDPVSDSSRSDLRCIRDAGQNLLGLIDDLLDQAEVRVDRGSSDRVPFDLHALVGRLGRQGTGDTCHIEVPEVLRERDFTVFGNRDRVGRVLTALIEQCTRLSPEGTIRLAVSPVLDRPGFAEVRFDVGPTRKEHGQDENSVTSQINAGLIANIGGQISVKSVSPHWLQYRLIFPADSRNKVVERMAPLELAPVAGSAGKRKLALVIDDDSAAIDLLTRWVRRCGYHTISATNGADGIELARECKPDIVLLDALMPGRSGYEVLPELRELPDMHSTPIMIVTVDDDRAHGLLVGATDVVRKPVTEAQLRSLIAIYEEPRSGDILIIDDDDDAAEILARTIRRLGFSPHRASNGEEGLEAVRKSAPRAILLDLNMPKLNGFEFIEALSKDETLAAIPLIVVSGADLSQPDHIKLADAGARFYLKGSAAPREIAEGVWEAVV